jgi:roadblock/LC7 domain-containing protein
VITETGTGSNTDNHYTMASNKKFIAGTQHAIGTTHPGIMIAQKKDPLTVYETGNLSGAFVYHQMFTSTRTGGQGWSYGAGSIASGVATISSETNSWGDPFTSGGGGTLAVDANGIVTMVGDATWQGFLSADKRTIVGVSTYARTGGNDYTLMIIQFTGQTYTAGLFPAGISASHTLACGSTPAPFWLHYTLTVDNSGVGTISNFVSSSTSIVSTGATVTGHISSSGTVTIDGDSSYHGQLSDDGKFVVYTDTMFSGIYSLSVVTR